MRPRESTATMRLAPADPEMVKAVWLRLPSAAALVDISPGALKQRILRGQVPATVIRKLGRTVLVHREKFLRWLEAGANETR
jgi:hypothetical protein